MLKHVKTKILTVTLLFFLIFAIVSWFMAIHVVEVKAAPDELIDSYSEANQDGWAPLKTVHPSTDGNLSASGQTFNVTSKVAITSCKFFLAKSGSPVGNLRAAIYAMTGTYGTDAVPTGSSLADSDDVDMTGLLGLQTFTFSTPAILDPGHYCVFSYVHDATTLNATNYVANGMHVNGDEHSGNEFYFQNSAWAGISDVDVCFYVYGIPPPPPTRVYFESTSSLGFQMDINKTVILQITSGLLNSTTYSFNLNSGGGHFQFTAINDTQITISYEGLDQVSVSGDQNNAQRVISSDTSITVDTSNNVRISWRDLPFSVIDDYFMLGVGLTGIIMLIAGPTIFARTFIKHGLDSESIEWLGYGMLFVVLGFGFVVVWLWPG